MRVLIVSGSRGEWGYYTPIIEEFKNINIKYDILCTNMAPLPEYGNLCEAIEKSGQEVKYKIFCSHHGGDHYAMAKSFSSLSASISDILNNSRYDWILIAGDRFEQFAVASVANLMYVPTAHIQAGELSGNVDGVTRHAIGKLVHLHFAANVDAYERLINIGEEPERVILSGAPQLDEVFEYYKVDKDESQRDLVLAVYHGLTEEPKINFEGCKNMVKYLNENEKDVVYILPNNDAGGNLIKQYILENKMVNHKAYLNVDRREYFKLMASAKYMIGNSSSGLLEAPVYRKPAVNIGNRQRDRVFGENVVHSDYSFNGIEVAVSVISSVDFKERLKYLDSPYGNEPAAPKIVQSLLEWSNKKRFDILNRRLTK